MVQVKSPNFHMHCVPLLKQGRCWETTNPSQEKVQALHGPQDQYSLDLDFHHGD
jgi:hypothetical protein